jgi:ATP-binding cassette subfamily C protein CydD
VSFVYESARRPALDGVSFRVPAGHKVALVGPIGAGKSTVAHLLLRFAEPSSGVIVADGVPLHQINARSWRSLLSWVPQRPHLFHGTVAENIRLGAGNASPEEVIEAARLAHLHEAVEELPLGYDTPIGEGGARLSGGQAQRLSLARAFLKDAPLLVLDEPTSQLDPEREVLVQESLRRLMKGRTVLLIAHRLNTVFDAGKIVLLSEGRVVEEGSHAVLLETGRLYPRLVAAFGGAP